MFHALEDIVKQCTATHLPMWKVILQEDCKESGMEEAAALEKMKVMYDAMKASIAAYDPSMLSNSGLVGQEAGILQKRIDRQEMLSGSFISNVMEKALRVAGCNACMKRIVASPTAGSCGVLPAVLVAYQETKSVSEQKMVEALLIAGGIGGVIGHRASLSGAQGGCQAEIGSASSMAAGALAYLEGGDEQCILNASAFALKNLLGLACDPVAGLVEVPCVKRNVMGAVNAVTSCDMAMAGITSRIPADEVIDAMGAIGAHMPLEIKETGIGGLAGTPTGKNIARKMSVETR